MKLINQIILEFKKLVGDKFYGEIVIHFKDGVPQTMNINKKVKLK